MVSSDPMSTARNTFEELLAQARQLPADEQQQLVARLQADKTVTPSEARREKAMKRWLARAGSGHADHADISSRKNEYLAEI
jgi:hypothetical protein